MTVVGGSPSTGTVTLTGVAPAGGMTVTLLSSNVGVATVPANVVVPAGAISITFTVSTGSVASATPITISASAGGVTQTATLTVTPAVPNVSDLSTYATGSGRITLYWTPIANATGYNIYRGTTTGGEDYAHPVNGSTPVNAVSYSGSPMNMYSDSGLVDGAEYFYTIKPVYNLGEGQASNEDSDTPDPSDVPWDSRNPSAIASAVRSAFSSDTNNAGADPFSLRVVGPDGTIYDEAFSTAQPPDGTIAAGSTQLVRPDGTSQTLPNDDGELVTEQASGSGTPPPSIGPSLKADTGPFRRVKTFANYRGADGYFALPVTDTSSLAAKANKDSATIYLGVSGKALEVDAGLTYSDATGWGLEMLITGGLRGVVAQPDPKSPKRIIPAVHLVNAPSAGVRFPSGATVRVLYWAWANLPKTGHQRLSMLLADDTGDSLAGALAGPTAALRKAENVAAKRVHSIGQKNLGVVATGSRMDNGAWQYGEVILPDTFGSTQVWNAAITAEHGSYDGGVATVDATELSRYTAESNISIDTN